MQPNFWKPPQDPELELFWRESLWYRVCGTDSAAKIATTSIYSDSFRRAHFKFSQRESSFIIFIILKSFQQLVCRHSAHRHTLIKRSTSRTATVDYKQVQSFELITCRRPKFWFKTEGTSAAVNLLQAERVKKKNKSYGICDRKS